MADRLQHRRDTAARWAEVNPVLLEGEIGYVLDNPNQHKIGDGEHAWNDLPLRGFTGTISQELGNDENAVVSQKVVTEAINNEKTRAKAAEQGLSDRIDNLVINGGGGGSTEVLDLLTSPSKTAALSANQGRVLNEKITELENNMSSTNEGVYESLNDHNDRIEQNAEEINNIKEAISENSVTIVQKTGASTTDVMSQKAVTDAINDEKERAERTEGNLSDSIGSLGTTVSSIGSELIEEKARAEEAEKGLSDRIDNLVAGGGGGSTEIEVIDNLTSSSKTAALSANQGKVLNDKIGDWNPNDYGDTITENLNTINKALEDSMPDEVPTEGSQSTVTSGGVYQAIEEAVDLIPVPNEEDVTKTEEGKLKFADREYDSLAPNGMGHVILRKNKALNEQITSNINNTIYEIRYDFDLGGETVYVGNGCVFKFVGGKISNGTIGIKNDSISEYDILRIEAGEYQIFDNVTINGYFNSKKIYVEWFGAKGDYNTDDTEAFRYAIKTLNGKGKSLYLGSNKIYVISGSINYYDGENNSISKCHITSDRAKNDEYPYDDKRPSCLFLKGSNISLFKGNEGVETAEDYQEVSMSIKLSNIEIVGSWINWYEQKNKLFDNCVLLGTSITDCSFKYLYCMFYQTGLWSVTTIKNNHILGIYNFSERGDLSSGRKVSFVDSSIKGNYINGGAPKADVLETVDNIFFDWNEFDGSTISENFIDFYCTMYNSGNYSAITTNNQYQVFKYFHKNCNVYSVCDRFSWNYGGTEEEPNAIYELMNRYKGIEYEGKDGNTYIIPPYIASDRYLGKNVIFKDMMIEGHIKNIIYRTGFGDSGNSGQKFIVQLHDVKNTKYYRNDAIVYPEGGGSDNTDRPVFCNVKPQCVIYIDPSLVTEVTTKPTLTDFAVGGWGKIGIGQVIKYGEALYQFNVYMNNGSMTKQVSLYMPENTIGHRTGTLANAPGSGTGGVANGLPYFATDINMPVFFNTQGWKYMCADGYVAGKRSGATAVRTALPVTANDAGLMFFDKDLGKVVVYNGSAWVNADDGYAAGPRSGARRVELTGSLTGLDAGLQFYDTVLRKLVIWNGDWWEDLDGNEIIDSENE